MAHLAIGKRTSFESLCEMYKKYIADYEKSEDEFEKAEIMGLVKDVCDFCYNRGGRRYWFAVVAGDVTKLY